MSKQLNTSNDEIDAEDEVIRIESEKGEYKQYYEERRRIELEQKLKQEEDDLNFAKLIASQEDSVALNASAIATPSVSQQGAASALTSQGKTMKKTQLSIDIALAVQSSLTSTGRQEGSPECAAATSTCSSKEDAVITLVDDEKWIQLKPPKAKVSLQNNTNKTNNTKHSEEPHKGQQRNINDFLMPAAINVIKTSDKNRISTSTSNSTSSSSSSKISKNGTSSNNNYRDSPLARWQCSRCTLFNPAENSTCDACEHINEAHGITNATCPSIALVKRSKLL